MRLRCCVPFCRSTRKRRPGTHPDAEWICGDHWVLISKRYRRVWGRINKKWRRFGPPDHIATYHRLWSRLKRYAIERAAGL
jgi:hypothetical protein